MKRLLILLSLAMITACNSTGNSTLTERLDALFSAHYPAADAPGTAVLVMKGDEVLFEKCYGLADLETCEPITPQTNFCIASISKQFSAVALLQLEERGLLSMNDPLSKFFPEFRAPFYDSITLHHIMSHTSGLPDARPRTDRNFVLYSTDVESCQYLIDLDYLNFPTGTQYEYINPTFQLVYQIVERVTGTPFEQYMHDNIFAPAGMDATLYFEAEREISNPSHGYEFDDEQGCFVECDYGETSFFASKADGGIYTSLRDFAKWEKALRGTAILSEESKRKAWTPHIMIPETAGYGYNANTGYGYGWFIQRNPNQPEVIYHLGDNGGYLNYAGRVPEHEILVVFFANVPQIDRIEMADAVYAILREEGVM